MMPECSCCHWCDQAANFKVAVLFVLLRTLFMHNSLNLSCALGNSQISKGMTCCWPFPCFISPRYLSTWSTVASCNCLLLSLVQVSQIHVKGFDNVATCFCHMSSKCSLASSSAGLNALINPTAPRTCRTHRSCRGVFCACWYPYMDGNGNGKSGLHEALLAVIHLPTQLMGSCWLPLRHESLAGYTIHTVVQLAHAGLLPLEQQNAVQQAFSQIAPALSTNVDTLTALVDKSLPTMIGLGGEIC